MFYLEKPSVGKSVVLRVVSPSVFVRIFLEKIYAA